MKTSTAWRTRGGYDTVTDDNSGFSLLLETDSNLLLEAGFDLLLEDGVVTPKNPSEWGLDSKNRTSWEARDGYSTATVGLGDDRITYNSDNRITEQGDQRITEPSTFSEKPRTAWEDA